jgi:hypothetical protein
MKIIKFDKDFKKLENKEFTTIRAKDKNLKLHDEVTIKSPNYEFTAEVNCMLYVQLEKVPTHLVCRDLDIDFGYFLAELSYSHLLDELREYIPKVDWEDYVYLYNFQKQED